MSPSVKRISSVGPRCTTLCIFGGEGVAAVDVGGSAVDAGGGAVADAGGGEDTPATPGGGDFTQ